MYTTYTAPLLSAAAVSDPLESPLVDGNTGAASDSPEDDEDETSVGSAELSEEEEEPAAVVAVADGRAIMTRLCVKFFISST